MDTPPTAGADIAVAISKLTDMTVLDQCGLPQPGRTLRLQLSLR